MRAKVAILTTAVVFFVAFAVTALTPYLADDFCGIRLGGVFCGPLEFV